MRSPPSIVLVISAAFGTAMAAGEFGIPSIAWSLAAALAWCALDRQVRGPPRRWWEP